MSTRSRIGIEGEDHTIRSVYCHSDGYPAGVGATLLEHHSTAEAAQRLTNLGDLSFCEGYEVSPPGERISGTVCSYQLWRDERGTDAITSTNRADYLTDADGSGGEHAYLYGPHGWEIAEPPSGSFTSLAELLRGAA